MQTLIPKCILIIMLLVKLILIQYLEFQFANNLKWNLHIDAVSLRARQRLYSMFPLKSTLDRRSLESLYLCFIRPLMEYGNVVWGVSYGCDIDKLERINIMAMRLITGAPCNSNIGNLFKETGMVTIKTH